MEKSSSKKKQYKLSGSLIESLHQAQKVANRIKPILPCLRYVEKNKAPFGGICVELFGDKEKILTKEVKQPLTKKLQDEIYSKDLRHSIMHGNYVGYEDEVLSANLIAVIVSLSFKAVEIERISKINPYWNKQEG